MSNSEYLSELDIWILSGMWLVLAPRTYTKNTCAENRNWTTCSKCDNHWIAPIMEGGGGGPK